ELNLGLESFVYVDDSAAECERVRQALPQVFTIHLAGEPALRADKIRALSGVFDTLAYSSEDRVRSGMYRAEQERQQLKSQVASLEDFYVSLAMELTIQRVEAASIARAAQLTQRTNQFNLTTRRYSESEILALTQSQNHEVFSARLQDRFGDNGLIGLAILRREQAACHIDTFLLSCRVIGRTVETAFLAFLLRRAQAWSAGVMTGAYHPTKKNGIVADFYARHGFQEIQRSEAGTVWQLSGDQFQRAYPPWFRIHTPEE
ncbi:MAG: HAD-IIIC family phosphatase, partial [Candidatus Binatia bacterium]